MRKRKFDLEQVRREAGGSSGGYWVQVCEFVLDEIESQKAITELAVKALEDQKSRMQTGHNEGYESETIFWTRCIWEIDQSLEEIKRGMQEGK